MFDISASALSAESDNDPYEGEDKEDSNDEANNDEPRSDDDGRGGGLGTRGARDLIPIIPSEASAISSELQRECLGFSFSVTEAILSSLFVSNSDVLMAAALLPILMLLSKLA